MGSSTTTFWQNYAHWIWLTVALAHFAFVWQQHRKLSRWVKRQSPVADPQIRAMVHEAQDLVGVTGEIPVIATHYQTVPVLFGWRHPHILLPQDLMRQLSPAELRMIVVHELVHLRRRDILQNWISIAVQSLHWFNPAVWWVIRRWRAERELACDATVLDLLKPSEHHGYGSTLLKLAGQVTRPAFNSPVTTLIETTPDIERRIHMIAHYKSTRRTVTIVSALLLAALGILTFTGAAEKNHAVSSPGAEPKELITKEEKTIEIKRADQNLTNEGKVETETEELFAKDRTKDPQKAIKYFKKESERLQEHVRQLQEKLNDMKSRLNMNFDRLSSPDQSNLDMMSKLEAARLEALAQVQKNQAIFNSLRSLNREQALQQLNIIIPDNIFEELLKNRISAEQRLAELTTEMSDGHPSVKKAKKLLETIERQMNERLTAILNGYEQKTEAGKVEAERLSAELEHLKKQAQSNLQERIPLDQIQRQLESMIQLQKNLQQHLMEAQIKAGEPVIP
jgi:beta-lactamase regulating signal transducer with metallopeptidase domain